MEKMLNKYFNKYQKCYINKKKIKLQKISSKNLIILKSNKTKNVVDDFNFKLTKNVNHNLSS